eukprot:518139_1
MLSSQLVALFGHLWTFTAQSRIGLVIPNNFESFQLICPEGSPFPCAATDGEFTLLHQYDLANHRFYEGYLGCENGKVAITTSGLSTINAALTTQLLIDTYRHTDDPIDIILNYGIAGGMDDRLSIGDVLVASKWAIYNLWVWQDEDDDVDDPLPLEQFGDYDRNFGYWETVEYGRVWFQPQELFLEPETRTRTMFFNASEDALDTMKSIETDIESKLLQCVPDTDPQQCLTEAPQVFTSIEGDDVIGLTASIFVDSSSWRSKLFEMYGAQSIDMESGSVAMVAATNEIPFLVFRSLSDLAGRDGQRSEIDTFFSLAVENSITVLMSWVEAEYCNTQEQQRQKDRDMKKEKKGKKWKRKEMDSDSDSSDSSQSSDDSSGSEDWSRAFRPFME